MEHRAEPDHRARYRHLADRRRLGFELERLWARIERHPAWPSQPPAHRRALHDLLALPPAAPHQDVARLETEVRLATRRLVLLAKALHALESGRPLPRPPAG